MVRFLYNPLNIRASIDSVRFLGVKGTDSGFLLFASYDYGIRAFLVLLRTYRKKYAVYTVSSIIKRYAPPEENPTSNYVSFVCDRLSVNRDFVIDLTKPCVLYEFTKAMCLFESGYNLSPMTFDSAYELFVSSNTDLFNI